MPVISVEIVKTIDEREMQKATKEKQRKEQGKQAIVKRWEVNDFVRLGFLQLICRASLLLMSNLELAVSIILKQRELCDSKHVAVECRCLKMWELLSFLMCSTILVLKWQQVPPI